MEVKRDEMTQELWDEWTALIREQECSICGAELTIRTVPERASLALGCPNPEHSGFRQRTSDIQEYRRGAAVYLPVKDRIEAKMMPKSEFSRAMNLLATRFPDAIKDQPGAALFINDCLRLGLDPLIQPAEAIPIPFKTKDKDGKEKMTVAMVVTEDGALSMAARGCPEEFDGAPATMPLLDYLMLEHPERSLEALEQVAVRTGASLCDDENAYVWVALGKRRSASSMQPVYGYFTQAEKEKAKSRKLPAGSQPGNQARVRAVKRWVRENFPEARQKMIEYTQEFYNRAEGALAAQEFIDAEYTIITGPLDKPALQEPSTPVSNQKKREPKYEPVEGNGFSIIPGEVKETLRRIKWSEETAKSWIAGNLGEDIKGDLIEGIANLSRDKAEKFMREIQERSDRQQPELFK